VAEFEGQAPMALERLATAPEIMTDGYDIRNGVLSLLPLLSRLVGLEASVGANLFHGTLAKALADFASAAARAKECKTIALSGGCFLNAVLTAEVTRHLAADGFTVLKAQRLSPGDGGLALGQAWIAALSCQ
jgi:hydrogenase maturation protein HypF